MRLRGMKTLRRAPRWLVLAAAVFVVQTLVIFAEQPGVIEISAVAIAMLLGWLLLLGSRTAWVLGVLSAVGRVVDLAASGSSHWGVAVDGLVIICLFVPASIRFVWAERGGRLGPRWRLSESRVYGWAGSSRFVSKWYGNPPIGGSHHDSEGKRRSYGPLLWRLGVTCVVLLMLGGAAYGWKEGSGRDSDLAQEVSRIIWLANTVAELAFVAVAALAIYRHFTVERQPSKGPVGRK
jgi:hypothetical protein